MQHDDGAVAVRGPGLPLKKRPRSPPVKDEDYEPTSKRERTTMVEYFQQQHNSSSSSESTTPSMSSSCGTSEEASDCESTEASNKLQSLTDDKLQLARERNRVHAQRTRLRKKTKFAFLREQCSKLQKLKARLTVSSRVLANFTFSLLR
jgi:hypothetical protein